MSNPRMARKSQVDQAREFLDNIVENSPEDHARIWFENALPEVRLAAFIKLDVKTQS